MSQTITSQDAWAALRTILDPEFGINIVDLGLIYRVECRGAEIAVTMTLTTEYCPSGNWIYEGVKKCLEALPGAETVNVAMVFEPPWTPAMLSEAARSELGLIN